MITVSVIQKNGKVRKRCLDAGSSSYLYYFQVRLFHLDPSTLLGHAHFLLKIFTRALESLKTGTLMESFHPK